MCIRGCVWVRCLCVVGRRGMAKACGCPPGRPEPCPLVPLAHGGRRCGSSRSKASAVALHVTHVHCLLSATTHLFPVGAGCCQHHGLALHAAHGRRFEVAQQHHAPPHQLVRGGDVAHQPAHHLGSMCIRVCVC